MKHRLKPLCLAVSATLAMTATTNAWAQAQTESVKSSDPTKPEAELPPVRARATSDPQGKDSVRATTTGIGKGKQALRDIPQSITVVTEKLLDDRNLDNLKDTLKNTSGISFQAAEGGEEDIRLRGFSLQSTGDIFINGMRDPAYYERDSFNWDRLEVLRGSASMLFGRGSTGGAVNQVTKQPVLMDQHEVAVTVGTAGVVRGLADFNLRVSDNAALRINAMSHAADGDGVRIDKHGLAPTFRWGIGTLDEFSLGAYYLRSENGIHYGLPWLAPGPTQGGNQLWPTDPSNYYGMASDLNRTGTTQVNASHVHRFDDEGELKTQLRVAEYLRDQRASAVRFAPAAQQPGGEAVTRDTFGPSTRLTRGTNNKAMNLRARYLQSDYTGKHEGSGVRHQFAAGMDVAHESFDNFALSLPTGVTTVKLPTTVGTPNDGSRVDEDLRMASVNRDFTAKAMGIYAQDLVALSPHWKVLGGLRWDTFKGRYTALTAQGAPTIGTPAVANPCFVSASTIYARSDSLLSHRTGILYQPTEQQSYHVSYGTSFNTSGDTYQYDAGTSKVDPESSRNLEIGAKVETLGGRLSMRGAVFHSTKFNERNRDSDSVNACNYVLSGKRHAAGVEIDLAGRLTPAWEVFASYSFIPSARVDASSGAAGTEMVGTRPGLTPRHTGTFWTTYKVLTAWRLGAGLQARSSDVPVGLTVGSNVVAPRYVTADMMVEYVEQDLSLKLNVVNISNKHTAEYLYRGHYVPGKGRGVLMTVAYKF